MPSAATSLMSCSPSYPAMSVKLTANAERPADACDTVAGLDVSTLADASALAPGAADCSVDVVESELFVQPKHRMLTAQSVANNCNLINGSSLSGQGCLLSGCEIMRGST